MSMINNNTCPAGLVEVPDGLTLDGAVPPLEHQGGRSQHDPAIRVTAALHIARSADLLAPAELVEAWWSVARAGREHVILSARPSLESLINFEAGKLADDAADPDAWPLSEEDHRLLWEGTAREVEITKAAAAVVLNAWRRLAASALGMLRDVAAPWFGYLVEQHAEVIEAVTAVPDWHSLATADDLTHFTPKAQQQVEEVGDLLHRYDAVHRLARNLRSHVPLGGERFVFTQTARGPHELAERAGMHPADRLAYDVAGGPWLPTRTDLERAVAAEREDDDADPQAVLSAIATAERHGRDELINYGGRR